MSQATHLAASDAAWSEELAGAFRKGHCLESRPAISQDSHLEQMATHTWKNPGASRDCHSPPGDSSSWHFVNSRGEFTFGDSTPAGLSNVNCATLVMVTAAMDLFFFFFFKDKILLGCQGCTQIPPMSVSRAAGTAGTNYLE